MGTDLIEVILSAIGTIKGLLYGLTTLFLKAKIWRVFRLARQRCLGVLLELAMRDLSAEVFLLPSIEIWNHILLTSLKNVFYATKLRLYGRLIVVWRMIQFDLCINLRRHSLV